MIVERITIILRGKYNLESLKEMGYKPIGNGNWYFDGKEHRYTFQPLPLNHRIGVTITKKPYGEHDLDHRITFSQVKDWVGKSVDAIAL